MFTPCEMRSKKFLPSLKARIAQELYERHDMTQVRIAARLGITQAAVSKYLSNEFPKKRLPFELSGKVDEAAKRLARVIAADGLSPAALASMVCGECAQFDGGCECPHARGG